VKGGKRAIVGGMEGAKNWNEPCLEHEEERGGKRALSRHSKKEERRGGKVGRTEPKKSACSAFPGAVVKRGCLRKRKYIRVKA